MHQLVRSTGSALGLAKGVPTYTVWANCGLTWPKGTADPMPPDLTAWDSLVTCVDCRNPTGSWAERGIPQ